MSLQEIAKEIIGEIEQNGAYIREQNLLFRAFNGNLEPFFEEKLAEINSESMKRNLRIHRTLPNYFQKCIRKVSGIYNFEVKRKYSENQNLFDWYAEDLELNEALDENNDATCALKASMLELYFKPSEGRLKLRTVPLDRYWVWTSDRLDPTEPMVFVKFLGDLDLTVEQKKEYQSGSCYILYSKNEQIAINCYKGHNNSLKLDVMSEEENQEHNMGFIPMIHVNFDRYNLIPEKDSASFDLAINPGMNWTSASVASAYQSHPIRYIINGSDVPDNLSINPDDILRLETGENDEKPEFGELASSLNLTSIIELIKEQVSDFMYTKDCPVKKDGVTDKSGVALMIESADTLENKKKQINYYKKVEQHLANIIAKYHNWLLKNRINDLAEDVPRESFSEKRIKVKVDFQLPSVEAEQQKEIRKDNDNGQPTENND
jgi:hypothetical protein